MTGYDTGGSNDINNDKIVYIKRNIESKDQEIDIGDIYGYCIATKRSTLLSAAGDHMGETPVVSGNVIVWSDSGSIYMTKYICRS